jgi:hypothetical protein
VEAIAVLSVFSSYSEYLLPAEIRNPRLAMIVVPPVRRRENSAHV